MTRSDTLRLRDIRDACRLIGECRDFGHDPALWHRRMLEGFSHWFGILLAAGGEAWWIRPGGSGEPLSAYTVSGDAAAEAQVRAYHRDCATATDPIFQAIQRRRGGLITRPRSQLVSDTAWYRSSTFNDYRKPGGTDHALTSVCLFAAPGATSIIALTREIGDRDFSPREQRLLAFFHTELGRLIRGPLASATEPGVERLAPRLRETLACLLEGDGEKQVAGRLGLSQPTVHQYVTALYRHFSVRSRAQLLAKLLRPRCDRPRSG